MPNPTASTASTVLASDPLTAPPQNLLANRVLLTVTGGETVFDAAAATLS
ncbi:hypothetical protein ITX31_03845 [Arthrobacter gandavensis]|nr:hypothetical protein [Arthrobacter gandavensis]MBF4993245.1 hypothetical protein [Arthrobacter gandavensis]